MKEIETVIKLQTNDAAKQLMFATRYLVQINFTFDLIVKSGNFSGTSSFCVRIDEIQALCDSLNEMYTALSGSAQLSDYDSDAFILFEMQDRGHFTVSGQVGGSWNDHFMTFKFDTDQTCLPQFISDFKALLKNQDN